MIATVTRGQRTVATELKEARGIDRVRSRFEEWRKTRSGKTPIPDELWSMAIDVARREGVNRTAQQLHLDAGKLKRLLVAADAGQHKKLKGRRQPGFVELIASAAGRQSGVRHRVRIGRRKQNAHSLEDSRCSGLERVAACLAGYRAMV